MTTRQPPNPLVTTVVLVDDHPAMLRATARLLEAAGITVVATADTATQGLAEVLRLRPRVAVLDDELPNGNGVDLCRAIRVSAPEVVVVVHSAGRDGDRARAAGAAEFVPKSAYGDALVAAVRRHTTGPRTPAPPSAVE